MQTWFGLVPISLFNHSANKIHPHSKTIKCNRNDVPAGTRWISSDLIGFTYKRKKNIKAETDTMQNEFFGRCAIRPVLNLIVILNALDGLASHVDILRLVTRSSIGCKNYIQPKIRHGPMSDVLLINVRGILMQ